MGMTADSLATGNSSIRVSHPMNAWNKRATIMLLGTEWVQVAKLGSNPDLVEG